MLHNKYNIFIWTHISKLRYSDEKYWKYFPLLLLPLLPQEISVQPSTRYARDGRIGRTRLASPTGERAALSNLRSIFHSRNIPSLYNFPMYYLLCWTASEETRSILKFSPV